MDLLIQPLSSEWRELIGRRPSGAIFDRSMEDWRRFTRSELGLANDRPIIATGHQTLLWHPGILAKYLATDAFAAAHDLATANLVVDQHVGDFDEFEIPIRKPDGALGVRSMRLVSPPPPMDVPMGRIPAFAPQAPPDLDRLPGAIESVNQGVVRIIAAVDVHRETPNAALQMALAIADLMQSWVRPMPDVTATALIGTSLGQAMMEQMIRDPQRCAQCYNRAVAVVPEAGIGPLAIRDDYVELPIWRIGQGGKRMRGYDSDVEQAVDQSRSKIQNPQSKIDLLPRALFMTALVRLGMCDLFVHGTGGALYDRAMEGWIKDWLGVDVGSIAVVTANVRLPLAASPDDSTDANRALNQFRRLWHDPEAAGHDRISETKRRILAEIEKLPRNSPQRRKHFFDMHARLSSLRSSKNGEIEIARQRVTHARRLAADAAIANRRDWAFPLYPTDLLDELAARAREAVAHAKSGNRCPKITSLAQSSADQSD